MRIAAALALTFAFCSAANAQTGDVVGVHDPCIIKEDGAYYVFSTGGCIKVRRSTDLMNWENLGDALPDLPQWAHQTVPEAKDRWAPDIAKFNGKYHLYYSVSTFGSNRSCIGVATNTTLDPKSPKYKWEDQGMVVKSVPKTDKFNAIDPNVVLDETNHPWLTFGSFWDGIMLVRLDPETGKATRTPKLIAGRKGGAIEAPFIVQHDGKYYLFVSFDKCCKGVDSTYKIMVGRSQKIDGPYVDFNGKKMIDGGGTLVLSGHGNVRGPGHNSVLTDKGEDFLVHHFYDAANGGIPTLQIRPLLWAKDGWPLSGEPIAHEGSQSKKDLNAVGKWEHSVNFGKGNSVTLHPNGTINSDSGKASWKLSGTNLELRWPRNDGPKGVWIDECLLSPDGRYYVGRNQQGMIIRGVRLN